jgi:ribosomal subunit interface protein
MIKKFEITGKKTKVTPDLQKYITRKIGKLDRFLPRQARESAHAEVIMKESSNKGKKTYTCEVILSVPQDKITVSQSTMNPFAAIDIAEDTLKNRIRKYKETHGTQRLHKKVLARMRRQTGGGYDQ